MSAATTVRKYGKRSRQTKAEQLFATLPKTPEKGLHRRNSVSSLTEKLSSISLGPVASESTETTTLVLPKGIGHESKRNETIETSETTTEIQLSEESSFISVTDGLRVITWNDVCPAGDRIEKIAEASYAEVYRISNDRGTSIIKVIRLKSPIKPQTKTQERSGLVDEEPHSESDLLGELRISELLADIPGFVVYKERYVVKGKAPRALLDTHQTFHRRVKKEDPDRLQFYPSPSRYLDDTEFMVVELGDAGTALEDFDLSFTDQVWDIFLLTAIALARAEDLVSFEHRDLHEGNLCIRQTGIPTARDTKVSHYFGFSGLEITILDYGLSRAQDDDAPGQVPIALDLEKDLSIFTSTHAAQCEVYRRMRSFLLKGDRAHLPPSCHETPYDNGVDGPITWSSFYPYTNVLWLAYLYQYMILQFQGEKKELTRFKRITKEMWNHLDPDAHPDVLSFSSASDVVRFAVEAGWLTEEQLVGEYSRTDCSELNSVAHNESIIETWSVDADESLPRRSPRRKKQSMAG